MDERVPELRDTLAVIWRRKIIVAVSVVAVTLLAVFYSAKQPERFVASSRIVIRSLSPASETVTAAHHDVTAETQGEVIRSELIAERVAKSLDIGVAPGVLSGAVSTRVVTEELLEISVSSRSPERAALVANAFAKEYLDYRDEAASASRTGVEQDLKRRMDDLQQQIDALDAKIVPLAATAGRLAQRSDELSPSEAAVYAEKQAEIRRLTSERDALIVSLSGIRGRYEDARANAASGDGGTLISRASVPVAPASPKPGRDGVVGFLLGLIAGIGLAFLREHFDDRVRTVEDASRAAGVPVLASIPRTRAWRRRKESYLAAVREPGSLTSEAYRQLRQGLVARGLGGKVRKVVFTSGGASAGKSASVANLAVVCANAGLKVACVSADMRRPRLHEFFGISNEAGLSDVLADNSSVHRALKPTGIPNLSLLPSGPVPPNAAELLDGARLDRVLSELALVADVVLVDCPPLASGADTLVLAPRADLSVLVMRADSARVDGSSAAVHELRQAGAGDIAAALTLGSQAVPRRHAYYYYETAADRSRNGEDRRLVPALPATEGTNGVNGSNGASKTKRGAKPKTGGDE